jgi:hypothetical protein
MDRISDNAQGVIMRDLENTIVQNGTNLLNSHAERLAACGMTWRGPEIEAWQAEPERYTSELRITILKDGEINDVLEFHVYDNGRALVTTEEAMNWMSDQLEALEKQDT